MLSRCSIIRWKGSGAHVSDVAGRDVDRSLSQRHAAAVGQRIRAHAPSGNPQKETVSPLGESMLDHPQRDFGGKRKLALRAMDGVFADEVSFGTDIGFGPHFVGGIRSAPIAPTTFVFGGGTAIRARNG
jgi:hypothetical protein